MNTLYLRKEIVKDEGRKIVIDFIYLKISPTLYLSFDLDKKEGFTIEDWRKPKGINIRPLKKFRRTLSWLSSGCNILDKDKEKEK